MKILFFSSNLYSQFPACFPNAVGALSAYLKREGFEVATLHLHRKQDMDLVEPTLRRERPDVVGISAVTCETPIIEPLAEVAKRWNPRVPVLVGGIHAIVAPETVMRAENVDAVCCGEGELAVAEYLRRLQNGEDVTETPNFIFRDEDGELRRTPSLPFIEDLSTLPFIDRKVTDLQRVINANNGVLNVIFSRGCPWHCRFCCNRDIRAAGSGKYARMYKVEQAMEELSQLEAAYTFDHILFRDDTFTWDRDWAIAFMEAYKARFNHPFEIFSRVDTLDEELMDLLAEAGCAGIFLGLDSGNDYIRNEVLNKEQFNDDLFKVTDYMDKIGIRPMISNIVGLPFETPQMFRDTIEINKKIHRNKVVFSPAIGACPKIWVFTPWPGSDLYRQCEQEGWLVEDQRTRKVYRETALEMPQFSPEEIDRQFRRFRYEVYRDNFPLHAMLYLIYDSKPFQSVFERIPMGLIGHVRRGVLETMQKLRPRV